MALHSLFAPALAQIEAKWANLPAEKIAALTANLPSLEERTHFLDWNARLSMQDKRLLEPCQATYAAVMAWNTLSDLEKVAVFVAGIDPLSRLAADLGLIGGVKRAVA